MNARMRRTCKAAVPRLRLGLEHPGVLPHQNVTPRMPGPSPQTPASRAVPPAWQALLEPLRRDREQIARAGGEKAIERQHAKGRLTARERIAQLVDPGTAFFELGRFAAWNMYAEWGSAP